MDQREQKYSCKSKSSRWSMIALSFLLDTTRVNAGTLLSLNKGQNARNIDSLTFGWDLCMELVRPHIQERSRNGLSSVILKKMDLFTNIEEHRTASGISACAAVQHSSTNDVRRVRCKACVQNTHGIGYKTEREKMKRVSTQCQICADAVCSDHYTLLCTFCLTNKLVLRNGGVGEDDVREN